MTDEPMPTPGRELVRPHVERLFAEILASQCAKGEAKYGTRLETFNGRDALNDALTELVDAIQYVVQAKMEAADFWQNSEEREALATLCEACNMLGADATEVLERATLLAREARAGRKLHDHLGVCFERWDDPLDAYEDWSTSKLWNVYAAARAAAGEE